MSPRVPTSVGSRSRSRANCATHAETRVTPARMSRPPPARSGSTTSGGRFRASATAATIPSATTPLWCRPSRPRTPFRSPTPFGARWATATTPRSGRTWRTGMSISAARRSRQAATDRTTSRALPLNCLASLIRCQASSGTRRPRSRSSMSRHSCSAHASRPSSVSLRICRSWISSRCATSDAAYSSCDRLSGRANQSVNRSPLGSRRPSSRSWRDASEGEDIPMKPAASWVSKRCRGTAPHTRSKTSRSWPAACITTSRSDSTNPARGARSSSRGSMRARPPSQATWIRATLGK